MTVHMILQKFKMSTQMRAQLINLVLTRFTLDGCLKSVLRKISYSLDSNKFSATCKDHKLAISPNRKQLFLLNDGESNSFSVISPKRPLTFYFNIFNGIWLLRGLGV